MLAGFIFGSRWLQVPLYVGLIGNQSLLALPVWELFFSNMPADARRIATDRVKWSTKYQQKHGIQSGPAELDPATRDRIQHLCKRAYRALDRHYAARERWTGLGADSSGASGRTWGAFCPADCAVD